MLPIALSAQSAPRIVGTPDSSILVRLPGSTHPLVRTAKELGRAPTDLPLQRILLQLTSSPEQEAALRQLLAEQQDPASPRYHVWLSPEQFGERFGASSEDIATIARWLESRGFEVKEIAPGRRTLEFGGTAGQVESAFRTRINYYEWNGERHTSNASDIYIPAALAPVIAGVASLNNFGPRPLHHAVALQGSPLTDFGSSVHALSPYDFATIYDLTPLWAEGYDGTGQSIAVIGESDIQTSDVAGFRAQFALPVNAPVVIVNGVDPGFIPEDQTESTLDVEWAGAVAKGATIELVTSASTNATSGIALSAEYVIQNDTAKVISLSYALCESEMGPGNLYSSLWQQAAAEGIAVFVANGDSGSAGCDAAWSGSAATQGFGINGLASTPYNVAVGGTELNDTASPSTYWNASNNPQMASARGYIPEVAWNESSYVAGGSDNSLSAGGGGISVIWPRPSWQTGAGVPSGNMRLTPDVSLTAAVHDGYLLELNGSLYISGGTSASAPAFAGLMAIVNQYTGTANGNPDANLYALASSAPSVYHDITAGSNAVPCQGGTPDCSAPAPSSDVGTMDGYVAAAGYDMATGLGSVDATVLVTQWGSPQAAPTIVSLNPNPMTGSSSVQSLIVNGTGFVGGRGLIVTVGDVRYEGTAVTLLSSSELAVSVNVGNTAQRLPVTVTVPNGATSNSMVLTVTPSPTPPTVSSLNPNQIAPSLSVQPLTVTGSGFVPGIGLKIAVGGTVYSGPQITSVSSTLLVVGVSVAAECHGLPVQVTNPNGQTSNSVSLTVGADSANVAYVQAVINQSLGVSPLTNDLNQDGGVNVMDVRLAINTILSSLCTASEAFEPPGHRP